MMYSTYDRLLSFVSVHHAIRAEKLLVEIEIDVVALPTPREIDISCGQCLLFLAIDQKEVMSVLNKEQAQWSRLFKRNIQDRVYEELEVGDDKMSK